MINHELIIDREKVIAALKECANETGHCSKCPYRTVEYCEYVAMADAAVLLTEQEPIMATWYQVDGVFGLEDGYKCGACNAELMREMRYCPYCGRRIKWND